MTLKTKKALLMVLVTALLISVVISVVVVSASVGTKCTVHFDEEIKEKYLLNSIFDVPNATLSYNDQSVQVTACLLYYPSGIIMDGNSFTLSETGKYKLVCNAQSNGVSLYSETFFEACQEAYSVSSETSCVQYVDSLVANNQSEGGLKVTLAEGDTFVYNRLVDVSNADLSVPFVRLYPYTYSLNYAQSIESPSIIVEAYDFVARITDYYDSDNYVEIHGNYVLANSATGRYHPYIQAKAGTQTTCGLQPGDYSRGKSSRRLVTVDGEQMTAYYGLDDYGRNSDGKWINGKPISYGDCEEITTADGVGFAYYYENSTRRTYFSNQTNKYLIADHDDPQLFDTNLFAGFTTGEAIISVYCQNYVRDTATFEIDELFGVKGSALNDQLIQDETAPVITVSNKANNFTICKDEPFTLFDATARDINLNGNVDVKVYYEYNTDNQLDIEVQDGKFIPCYVGKYSIIYEATDSFGNVAIHQVDCYCQDIEGGKVVDFDVEELSQMDAGATVTIPEHSISSPNGNTFVSISVTHKASGETQTVDEITRRFVPTNVGEYAITYRYGDQVSHYEYSYDVMSNTSDNVTIQDIVLPQYLIRNSYYTFDVVLAKTFTSEIATYVEPQVYVSVDGKSFSSNEINYEDFFVEAKSSIQFKYVYNEQTLALSPVIPVIDVSFDEDLKMVKYFVGDVSTSSTRNNVTLMANQTTGNCNIDFINIISLSQFSVKFDIPADANNFDSVDFILTDYYNRDNKFIVNVDRNDIGSGSELKFVSDGGYFTCPNGQKIYCDGTFTNDKTCLSIVINGINGSAGLNIYKLSNQVLSNRVSESVNPNINIDNSLMGYHDINEVITINPVAITDILSPYYYGSLKFNVTDGNGNYCVALDGTVLHDASISKSYQLKLDKYGIYSISYQYSDQSFNEVTVVCIVYVNDSVCPTICLDDNYDENTLVTAKFNKTIKLQGYTVSDDYSATDKLKIIVRAFAPDNRMIAVSDDMQLTLSQQGLWHIVYYVSDEAGNCTTTYYLVEAK